MYTILRFAAMPLLALIVCTAPVSHAQKSPPSLSSNAGHLLEDPLSVSDARTRALMENFSDSRAVNTQLSGELLYQAVCQGCHMPQGQGTTRGAGIYPPLANNPRLAAGAYPVLVVMNGLHGMPAFSGRMNDQQIAEIANYVRTNFGNRFTDEIKPEDVKAIRTPSR